MHTLSALSHCWRYLIIATGGLGISALPEDVAKSTVSFWHPRCRCFRRCGEQADIICDASGSTEAEACPEGYVCEESSNSEESVHFPCREGYVCDFGTTPDPDLEAPEGQFTQLCPVGFVCTDATGLGQAYRQVTYHGNILVETAVFSVVACLSRLDAHS